MKRLYTTLIGLILTIALFAQATPPHLKFMGIPIDGTITQFQAKLQAKGCTYDKASSTLPSGARAYHGLFAGEKVAIYVYYNPNTKIVYQAKAVIQDLSNEIADIKYNKFKELLRSKYGTETITEDVTGDKSITFSSTQKNIDPLDSSVMYVTQGNIDLYIYENRYNSILSPYNVHIDYIDKQNFDKHNNTILNDI